MVGMVVQLQNFEVGHPPCSSHEPPMHLYPISPSNKVLPFSPLDSPRVTPLLSFYPHNNPFRLTEEKCVAQDNPVNFTDEIMMRPDSSLLGISLK